MKQLAVKVFITEPFIIFMCIGATEIPPSTHTQLILGLDGEFVLVRDAHKGGKNRVGHLATQRTRTIHVRYFSIL